MPYKNPEDRREQQKRWRLAHPGVGAERSRLWYLANKERHRDNDVRWSRENPEKVKAIRARGLEKHRFDPVSNYKQLIYKYKNRGENPLRQVIITKEDFTEWFTSQKYECFYCGITMSDILKSTDHYLKVVKKLGIDRMDTNLPYQKGNLALACHRCNSIKNDFFTADEMKKIGEMFVKPKFSGK